MYSEVGLNSKQHDEVIKLSKLVSNEIMLSLIRALYEQNVISEKQAQNIIFNAERKGQTINPKEVISTLVAINNLDLSRSGM